MDVNKIDTLDISYCQQFLSVLFLVLQEDDEDAEVDDARKKKKGKKRKARSESKKEKKRKKKKKADSAEVNIFLSICIFLTNQNKIWLCLFNMNAVKVVCQDYYHGSISNLGLLVQTSYNFM